jgi:UDP-N-acetylglucosamine acyltransferase
MERAGFSAEDISDLKKAYRLLYASGLKLEPALDRIAAECKSVHSRHLVDFVRSSERGICRP